MIVGAAINVSFTTIGYNHSAMHHGNRQFSSGQRNLESSFGQAPLYRARILVVDDHELCREAFVMMAQRLNIAVAVAQDWPEAQSLIADAQMNGDPFSLILMDLILPGIDGVEATRIIRAGGMSADYLPVVALSGIDNPDDKKRFFACGGQAWVTKPITLEKLQSLLDVWVPGQAPAVSAVQLDGSEALKIRYLQRKAATIEYIDLVVKNRDASAARIENICQLLHKLSGSAGFFGEAGLAGIASDCEVDLKGTSGKESLDILSRYRGKLTDAA